MSSENSLTITVAVICALGGLYALLAGISTIAQRRGKIPGFSQYAVFMSNLLYGKERTTHFEKEMMDRKKAIRYGTFWIFIGVVALASGVFLLLVK